MTIQQIAAQMGLNVRTVRGYIADLEILPVNLDGRVHIYAADTIQTIQRARLEAARLGRKARHSLHGQQTRIISVKEAKHRAKRIAR